MIFDHSGLGADFEEVLFIQDPPSGLRAIIAIHSTRLGPAAGGIRRLPYASEQAALDDVMKLAAMMTAKCALAGLDAGGAKTVILDHPGLDHDAAYRALGRAIERLGGRYLSGPDVGTGDAAIEQIRHETAHVNPAGNDAGAATARGVLAGMRGLLEVLDGSPSFAGKRFVVQGLGAVGIAVARGLLKDGGIVSGTDVNAAACEAARKEGITIVAPDAALTTPCDVFVPCALGGILTAATARTLPARGVCGSANNQLADVDASRILHERGVLVAPDFVVNSGAVIEGVLTTQRGATDAVRADAAAHIDRIQQTTARVLRESRESGVPPDAAAMRTAEARA